MPVVANVMPVVASQMPQTARTYIHTYITIQTDKHTGRNRITLCCTR